jgi:hypothetical protein
MQLSAQPHQFADFGSSLLQPSRAYHRSAIVVDDVVFRKSVAGHNEVEHRHTFLRPELRRLLILIDGHSAIDEFAPLFRRGDLPRLFDELLALGLVESVSTAPLFKRSSLNDVLARTDSLTPAQFEAARRAALHATSELLGRLARPYCDRIVACTDSAQFREVLDDVSAKLSQLMGSDAVTLFIETVRDGANGART